MAPRPTRCDNSDCKEDIPAENLKRCAGCKSAWYCSSKCQKRAWRTHIFDCDPKGPIATVYYLSRACFDNTLPVDAETRDDFGFMKAEHMLGGIAPELLLGLWTDVLVYLGVSEKAVRVWQAEGRMVEGIEASFAQTPEWERGQCYAWFLRHKNILDGSPLDEEQARELEQSTSEVAYRKAWVMSGGSVNDSAETIQAAIKNLPGPTQACHELYRTMARELFPGPQSELWTTFGFVAAMHQPTDTRIGHGYGVLVFERCTFEELVAAYTTSSIPDLMETRVNSMLPLTITDRFFRDIMSESPRRFKTVWYLKHYIDLLIWVGPGKVARLPHRAIATDYGFGNVQGHAEWVLLDELYTKYFGHKDANPLDLHEACIEGSLVKYLSRFVKPKPKTETYKRLLKNTYPQPHLGKWQGWASHEDYAKFPAEIAQERATKQHQENSGA